MKLSNLFMGICCPMASPFRVMRLLSCILFILVFSFQVSASDDFRPALSSGTATVSYTHLDVYKRQVSS